ncbi:MAG: DNA cytosine methyltransferase [Nitrospirota bacterium]|nr:DNA cytosine methyltransferase [Nitrospirota bacterium]
MKPLAIDLFSGCGGLTLGLKQAGFRVVGAVEIDPLAVRTYKVNHKQVVVWEQDISELSVSKVMEKLKLSKGQLDLLAGCPPCQGFSALRTRNGANQNRDYRNSLIHEMLRFIRVLRPKAVMMENVPGLKSKKQFRDFYRGLKRLGYKVGWNVKDAARYGVPQRRKRLILLAGVDAKISFADESKKRRTVRHAIGGLAKAGSSGDAIHDIKEKRTAKVLDLIKDIPRDGGSRLDLPNDRQLTCHKNCDGFKDIYGRMAWKEVAPTITSGCLNPSKGRFIHPKENRAITMREAALLQSFPRDYWFPSDAGKQAGALMIGNALPPEFIRRHAVEIRKHLLVSRTSK